MEFYIDKLFKIILLLIALKLIINIMTQNYYVKGLIIQGEKVFKSKEDKNRFTMINRVYQAIVMTLFLYAIRFIMIPLISFVLKNQ